MTEESDGSGTVLLVLQGRPIYRMCIGDRAQWRKYVNAVREIPTAGLVFFARRSMYRRSLL